MNRRERDPIVNEAHEHLRRLDVKGVLFDKDDTLIYTSEIFKRFMGEYIEEIVSLTGVRYEEIYDRLSEINNEEYLAMGVNPLRWSAVVERLAGEYAQFGEVIRKNLPILQKIYTTVPRLMPGAKQILSGLRESGFKVGVVTHANREWAEWKMTMTGLSDYVDIMVIADENSHKGKEHWEQGMQMLGLAANNSLVVGDNVRGDIVAGTSLGARAMWIPSPWSVYREGDLPENVVTIESLNDFWGGTIRLR